MRARLQRRGIQPRPRGIRRPAPHANKAAKPRERPVRIAVKTRTPSSRPKSSPTPTNDASTLVKNVKTGVRRRKSGASNDIRRRRTNANNAATLRKTG
jgi:hypothetical protein